MARFARLVDFVLLVTFLFAALVRADDIQSRPEQRPDRPTVPSSPQAHPRPQSPPRFQRIRKPSTSAAVAKRGIPGRPGDIEWMGFYGSLLAVPTMLSILGIQTNYNLEKSYFNSQLNAQYYKQSRELLRAHALKLTRDQETKFAKAGYRWPGMIWDAEGRVRDGARVPTWGGKGVGVPTEQEAPKQVADQTANGASGAGTEGSGQGVIQVAPGTVAGPGEGGSGTGAGAGGHEGEKPIEVAGAQGAASPGTDAAAIGRAGGNAQDATTS